MAIAYNQATIESLSITERYSDSQGLVYIFEQMNLGNNERDRIFNDSLTTISEIVDQYNYDIKSFMQYLQNLNKTFASAGAANRIYFSPPAISQLCGCLFYYNHCVNTLHIIPDVMEVDIESLQSNYSHYKELNSTEDDDSDAEDVEIPTLKGHDNWTRWRDAFIANLSTTIGSRGIPIDYLIDSTERQTQRGNATYEEYETVNLTDDNLFKTMSVHYGVGYKLDNTKLWKRIKSCLLNTDPYHHVSDFNATRNGRSAWKALLDMYQGTDYNERMKDSAFASLKNAHYRGETKTFNWEKYVNIHKECHRKLLDAGYNNNRGMDEETKIHHLKANIRADAGLENALLLARSNLTFRNDFPAFVSFISTEVAARKDRLKQLKDSGHKVAGLHASNNKNNKNKTNKSTSSNRFKDRPSKVVDGKRVFGAKYPAKEYSMLTRGQKKAVIELKRQYWESRGSKHISNFGGRSVKSLATAVQEDIQTLENRIISAIQQGQSEEADDIASKVSFDSSTIATNKRKSAPSGSIGQFLGSQRKQKTQE